MPNHLAKETSPYLRQHADNPVDWYPWGEEALNRARQEDKPILLSIGYSACHWCHVMAHESFEDPDVASVMNQLFINIKVDREERPDLDHIYQLAHSMLTQRNGGWPLTMVLTPDQVPYFAGTYFPKSPRYGLPGFADLLRRVEDLYRNRREDVAEQNASLLEALQGSGGAGPGSGEISRAPLEAARARLKESFDPRFGGFGEAPKFPHPGDLFYLLRDYAIHGDTDSRHMACFTLRKMAEGGLYDQLGGGFYRYSVDEQWLIPHFEKMLYDNGLLLAAYAEAAGICRDSDFHAVIEDTVAWALREMRDPQGGFYSALDADTEGGEGAFYVWTPKQVQGLLTPEEYAVFAPRFGLEGPANFEGHFWHLFLDRPLGEVASSQGLDTEAAQALIRSAREKLFVAREKRARPGLDNKVLTSWNGLMIQGLARAASALDRPDWTRAAQQAVDFIRRELWRDGRLLATYTAGQARLNAYLDDYAFLLNGLLELMQAEFRSEDLAFARNLADVLLEEFEDKEEGGFFFTGHSHEQLIQRPKNAFDAATPAGNSVAAFALQRLGHLLGDMRYLHAAERTLRSFYGMLERFPGSGASMLLVLEEYLSPPRIVILRGEAERLPEWRRALEAQRKPDDMILALPNGLSDLPDALNKPQGHPVGAWICQGVTCSPEVTDLSQLI
ncbi:thioredoxin domain-containing protein [Thermithiobacillus plumbiphilus]|uniref:Thioredoxin domain-containing protein n=1 Tax=Thermithiobacillus plumbiphilus TaxID=1729899 RepID=A0ABU9D4L9_9PROT